VLPTYLNQQYKGIIKRWIYQMLLP
jgi:hypothetical protein